MIELRKAVEAVVAEMEPHRASPKVVAWQGRLKEGLAGPLVPAVIDVMRELRAAQWIGSTLTEWADRLRDALREEQVDPADRVQQLLAEIARLQQVQDEDKALLKRAHDEIVALRQGREDAVEAVREVLHFAGLGRTTEGRTRPVRYFVRDLAIVEKEAARVLKALAGEDHELNGREWHRIDEEVAKLQPRVDAAVEYGRKWAERAALAANLLFHDLDVEWNPHSSRDQEHFEDKIREAEANRERRLDFLYRAIGRMHEVETLAKFGVLGGNEVDVGDVRRVVRAMGRAAAAARGALGSVHLPSPEEDDDEAQGGAG